MSHTSESTIYRTGSLGFPAIVSESTVESVLLVEGDPTVRQTLASALKEQSFHVVEASDGSAALHLLREMKGALEWLVTNVSLGDVGGLHVAFEYRFLFPTRPIVFIDGRGLHRAEPELLSGSVTLRPPFSAADLMHVMSTFRDDRNVVTTIGC